MPPGRRSPRREPGGTARPRYGRRRGTITGQSLWVPKPGPARRPAQRSWPRCCGRSRSSSPAGPHPRQRPGQVRIGRRGAEALRVPLVLQLDDPHVPDRPQAARCRRTGPGRGASRAGPGARAASRARARQEDQQEHRGGQQPPPALHQHRLSLGFFTDKLLRQRQASPNTIAAYRDTCKLLLDFASRQARKQPCQLDIADLDAPLITAFLQHLETGRATPTTTRTPLAGRDPLPVPLRGAAHTRTRRPDQPGAGHPVV